MHNRIASLFELDELLGRGSSNGTNGAKKKRRAARRAAHPPATAAPAKTTPKPVAQSFDRGDPIRCEHGHAYRASPPVEVGEPADYTTEPHAASLGADYTVEAFDDTEDEEESSLLLSDIEEEDRLAGSEASPSLSASVDAPYESGVDSVDEEPMPASFAEQMTAVERDLADLATRVQTPAPTPPSPVTNEGEEEAPLSPAPSPPSGHGVFDTMAKGMAYATEFRLPPLQLSQVFSALDKELDAEEHTGQAPVHAVVPPGEAPAATAPTPAVPASDVLLKDLVAMPRAEPAPEAPKSPETSSV